MSKILIFSDLHCHMHKGLISRLHDCLNVLHWVFQTAIKRGIKVIVFAGDLYQDRQKIHVISYEKTFRIIKDYCKDHPDLKIFLLVGNHDMWFNEKWDVSSVAPLEAIENVKVIAEPCAVQVSDDCTMDFLPYTKNPLEDIKTYFPKKNSILISHIALDGAQLSALYQTKAEISVEYEGDMVKVGIDSFKEWQRVFLGHYHCAQKLNDRVEYIGSPLELSFGEAFQQKHIIVLDTDTFETEYVINDFSPKHLIIKESEIEHYDLENNFVQVVVEDITSIDIVDVKKSIKDRGFSSLEFKEKTKKKEKVSEEEHNEIKEEFDANKGILSGDLLLAWIEAKRKTQGLGNLDQKKLNEIGQNIIRRS